MKTRTFQEIYDFCRTDDTYRSYFEASDESRITGARARKYYYGDIRRGQCRVGTFIYCQSMRQLERFLEGASFRQIAFSFNSSTTSMLTRRPAGK